MNIRKISLAAALTTMLALAACNTVDGAGKDMKSAGDTVAKTANKAK